MNSNQNSPRYVLADCGFLVPSDVIPGYNAESHSFSRQVLQDLVDQGVAVWNLPGDGSPRHSRIVPATPALLALAERFGADDE